MKKFLVIALIAAACNPAKQTTTTSTTPQPPATPPSSVVVNGKLFTSIYQQKAAEYKALCFQAYNLAIIRLDQAIARRHEGRLAVITDIDETVLDNSMYAINRALQGKDYESLSWSQWIERAEADTVPGAAHFLKYCASKNVEVFYITNRDEKDRNGTMKSLDAFNLPFVDDRHVMMRQGGSSKETRRLEIMSGYNVVLFVGDNLADFTGDFDKKTQEERQAYTQKMASEFGNRFILIPNPVYGDWEAALYNNNNNYSLAQKDSIFRTSGKTY
jgi:5'-nucleotidase (lipoprotein e(P4) family)